MSKLHKRYYPTDENMPEDEKLLYTKQGLSGALCGYMRKTTHNDHEVTCFYCLKIMERRKK